MMELIDKELAMRLGLFIASGVVGMFFGYYRRWSFEALDIKFWSYMFGDWHAVGRALTTLAAMCAGAGGLSYLDGLTMSQIIIAGAGIGILVPQTVDKNKKDVKHDNKS